MEECFALAKELNQSWEVIERMTTRERKWLMDRLIRFYEEQKAEEEKLANDHRASGGGGLKVDRL